MNKLIKVETVLAWLQQFPADAIVLPEGYEGEPGTIFVLPPGSQIDEQTLGHQYEKDLGEMVF